MKHSNTWFALILIALGLLLSAANAEQPSLRPAAVNGASLSQQANSSAEQTQGKSVSPSATPKTSKTEPSEQSQIEDRSATNKGGSINRDSGQQAQGLRVADWIQIVFNFFLVAATVALAIFTGQLVRVTGDLHEATKKGTEVAEENVKAARASADAAHAQLEFTKTANEQNLNMTKQSTEAAKQSAEASARMVEVAKESARAAELALNAERPYVFLEGQQIAVTLCLSGFANMLKHPVPIDVSADPLAYKGVDPRDAAECQLYFELRNRGKGVAVIRNVHIRMLIGKGLEENGARLWTAGRCDGHIRLGVKVLGLGETAHVSSSGLQLNLDQLGIIKAWGASLQFVVLVSYDDVYRRHYSTTFPFEYRPPVPDVIRQGLFSGPLLVPAFKRLRRRYG